MIDAEELKRRYAAASDAELREARRLGSEAFRPEAWAVIQAELGRRQLRRERGRPRVRVHPREAARAAASREWTPGLLVGIVPAGIAAVAALRALGGVGMLNGRGGLAGPVVIFFSVWFGIALVVDWRRWFRGSR